MTDRPTRVLFVYPNFVPNSFWGYTEACKLIGARYPAAPLGLITVAALLPQDWEFKLINCNTEDLELADIDWADMVMTGGMLNQQPDCIRLIDLCHERGKPVVVGGPDVTSSPHLYKSADFQVLGEAEEVIKDFVAAWRTRRTLPAYSPPRNSQSTSPRRRCRASTCSSSTSISTSASSTRAAARSPASSATSSSSTAACRAPRPTTRSWRSCSASTISAIAAMSISSTTT